MISPRESVMQLAYLTRPGGLETALDFWIDQVGAGPFYIGSFPLMNQTFHGKPTDMTCVVALGYHGDMQIELIEPTNNAPGPYREWLEMHPLLPRGGLYHHIMMDHVDFDATYARYLAAGCKEGFIATAPSGGRIAYLEAFDTIGGYIELVESNPGWSQMCVEMREISRNWDGGNPRRGFETLNARIEPIR